jgi:hypothetical protein
MAVRSPVPNKPFIARFGIAPRKPEHRIFHPPGTPSMTTTLFVALRPARALAGKEEQQFRVFLRQYWHQEFPQLVRYERFFA